MLHIKKYAAIDIGSNAVRLLIANVISQENKPTLFRKNALVRVPIRLGEDVFLNKKVSERNLERMTKAMKSFKLLMDIHDVSAYRACATSAMRDAENVSSFTEKIKNSLGIDIEIINGEEEAAIIAQTDLGTYILDHKDYLYVDVGGGSTELTVYQKGNITASKSFKIGTVRLLNNLVNESHWIEMTDWIKRNTKDLYDVQVIGSGGNINKVFKLSGAKQGKPLSYLFISKLYNQLNKLSYEERIIEYALNPDRADVIIPAIRIYLTTMKSSSSKSIIVPKIGLVDGIIKDLYKKVR